MLTPSYYWLLVAKMMPLQCTTQILQAWSCQLFQKAQKAAERPGYFWPKVRSRVDEWLLPDWETLYGSVDWRIDAQIPKHSS